MTKIEAFRRAVAELGEAKPEAISEYIKAKFGIEIKPQFVPIYWATLRMQKDGDSSASTSEDR